MHLAARFRGGCDRGVAMLILTRRVGETLMIGDSITVTVLGVKGNQVRIGITAPKDVAVHRRDLPAHPGRRSQQGRRGREALVFAGSGRSLYSSRLAISPRRRVARVAEGAPLLREYRVKSLIEGSNPSLSASLAKSRYASSKNHFSLTRY